MAEINFINKRTISAFLDTGSGYVLDFSNPSFRDFVADATGLDIESEKYFIHGASKGKRLKAFIEIESNETVGILLYKLHGYKLAVDKGSGIETNKVLADDFLRIARNLKGESTVEDLDAIQASTDDKDFKMLADNIRESIEKNEPEAALDRLHTYLVKFFKELCQSHGIEFNKEESLNAIYGKYIRYVVDHKLIESKMAEIILKYSISVIQAFNDIRNNKSFAHDNPVLNYNESILIFNNLSSCVKFITNLEEQHKNKSVEEAKPDWIDFAN